ncbi:3'-5' exoribonuclease [Actinotignum schaalii]|uniref:exonuclease domain-containing protein n=1 Tax=Actinotignum schaalii TaxID=59505 RepID=UPI00237DB993|nr:exonuclease domain-containing protein [Actinotignum schaalii]MDE1654261.1 3'-5' exoribonuclease [Actinotignum schaalii]
MRDFVAIDFETANEQRCSACAVGLTLFDSDGNPADSYYQLLKPHPEVAYFNPVNVWVHGITEADVLDAPQWSQVSDQVATFVGDRPIIAHNMAFDGYVLSDLVDLYGTKPILNRRFCTARLARKILAGKLERKSLDQVFGYYFPDKSFDHHHAGSDAQAAGMIFARMQQEFGFERLEELCPPTGGNGKNGRAGVLVDQLVLDDLLERYGKSRVLEGEHVAFTGTLRHGQRAAVQQLVSAVGGTADKNLTKKTTLLVVGIPNPGAWTEGSSASRKLHKARQLRESGSSIEVVSEDEFFNRLAEG